MEPIYSHQAVRVCVCVLAVMSARSSFYWIVQLLKWSSSDLPDLVEAPPLEGQTACRAAVVKITEMLFNERLLQTKLSGFGPPPPLKGTNLRRPFRAPAPALHPPITHHTCPPSALPY